MRKAIERGDEMCHGRNGGCSTHVKFCQRAGGCPFYPSEERLAGMREMRARIVERLNARWTPDTLITAAAALNAVRNCSLPRKTMTTPSDLKAALVEAMAEAVSAIGWRASTKEKMEAALASLPPVLERFGIKALDANADANMTQAMHSALYRWREAQGDPQQDPSNMQKHAIRFRAAHDAAPTVPWEE